MVFRFWRGPAGFVMLVLPAIAWESSYVMTGDEIREARERAGLTQAQLGKAVGVSLRTIGNWERGETPVAPRMQSRLLQALNAEHPSVRRDPLGEASDVELLAEIAKRFARTAEPDERADADDLDPAAMAEVLHRYGHLAEERGATVHRLPTVGWVDDAMSEAGPKVAHETEGGLDEIEREQEETMEDP